MSLWRVRPSILRRLPFTPDIVAGLRAQLTGRVVAIPADLPAIERDEIVDFLVLFLDFEVVTGRIPSSVRTGCLHVDPTPWTTLPAASPGAVLVGEVRRPAGTRGLDAPKALRWLRDAVAECIGRVHSDTPAMAVASWVLELSDTPSLAMRFADGALRRFHEEPTCDPDDAMRHGLGEMLRFMRFGVPAEVWIWASELAFHAMLPQLGEQALSTRSTAEDMAVRGLAAGLVESFGEEGVMLRRPLQAIREGAVPKAVAAMVFEDALADPAYAALRASHVQSARRLELGGPPESSWAPVDGGLVHRLAGLLEQEGTTVVLHGGHDKRSAAARTGGVLAAEHGTECVWVDFYEGPVLAWARVALALDLRFDLEAAARGELDWVHAAQAALSSRRRVVIIEWPEVARNLRDWVLPRGSLSSQLILSPTPVPLGESHDAVQMHMVAPRLPLRPRAPLHWKEVPDWGAACTGVVPEALLVRMIGLPGVVSLVEHGAAEQRGRHLHLRMRGLPGRTALLEHRRAVFHLWNKAASGRMRRDLYFELHLIAERFLSGDLEAEDGALLELARMLVLPIGDARKNEAAVLSLADRATLPATRTKLLDLAQAAASPRA